MKNFNIDAVMSGGLDPIIDALTTADQAAAWRSRGRRSNMVTQYFRITDPETQREELAQAAAILREGGLLGIPRRRSTAWGPTV